MYVVVANQINYWSKTMRTNKRLNSGECNNIQNESFMKRHVVILCVLGLGFILFLEIMLAVELGVFK